MFAAVDGISCRLPLILEMDHGGVVTGIDPIFDLAIELHIPIKGFVVKAHHAQIMHDVATSKNKDALIAKR
ncbi:hypothetical protein SDC9_117334 [bioreactor metagenome]|uniref:Uncharacterized protein n=1 Tax=bioreactor metagenome TaxID=1076179 RepID=A0A645BYD6_9ZZZZ